MLFNSLKFRRAPADTLPPPTKGGGRESDGSAQTLCFTKPLWDLPRERLMQ